MKYKEKSVGGASGKTLEGELIQLDGMFPLAFFSPSSLLPGT